MSPKAPQKKKKARAPLSQRAKRLIVASLITLACIGMVIATGLFINQALTDIDRPPTTGVDGVRVEGVNETMLEATTARNEARRSDANALPSGIQNPFVRDRAAPPPGAMPPVPDEAASGSPTIAPTPAAP